MSESLPVEIVVVPKVTARLRREQRQQRIEKAQRKRGRNNLDFYQKVPIIGGGCKCPSRPNCGHYSDINAFGSTKSGKSVSQTKKKKQKKSKRNRFDSH